MDKILKILVVLFAHSVALHFFTSIEQLLVEITTALGLNQLSHAVLADL